MKALQIITGVLAFILGLLMSVFAWIFFITDDEAMVVLASLYIAQFISVLFMAFGFGLISERKKK